MAFPSVTYTFVNGNSSDATQVNQNFSDIIAAFTDGSKSINIGPLTITGATSLNGSVTLGLSGSTITIPSQTPSATSLLTVSAAGVIGTGRLSALGNQISSSCTAFTTSSTSFVAITNLAVTITTSGRPVIIGLVSDGSSNASAWQVPSNGNFSTLELRRGVTPIADFIGGNFTGVTTLPQIAAPAILAFDAVAAGTYTYTLYIKVNAAVTVNFGYYVLFAYEL